MHSSNKEKAVGYYRSWILVFAALGYCFGLSAGLSAADAVWMVPCGGTIGLIVSWFSSEHEYRVGLQAWMALWCIAGFAMAGPGFGWPWWGAIPFAVFMAAVGIFVIFALDFGPAAKYIEHHEAREHPRTSNYVPL